MTSKIATRDRAIDFAKPGRSVPLSPADRELNTQGTELIPVDGIVKQTSDKIVGEANARSDIEKARAIYEWIVDNTFRDAKVRGCGIGDIAAMLKTGNLGGKCADLNALYVGLARAAGVPARDVYGIRVAPSKFGYKSLGASAEDITKAQHCRSEVYLAGFGWVPVDPADVRKVVLEEPPTNLGVETPKSLPRARRCSDHGKPIGLPTTLLTTSLCRDRAERSSPFSCIRRARLPECGSIVSIPKISNTPSPLRSWPRPDSRTIHDVVT